MMNPAELKEFIPQAEFVAKRVYWLKDIKGEAKSGQHCHTDDENEIFIVIKGTVDMVLDDGSGMETVNLTQNNIVWVPRLVWHGFEKLSPDAIVLALTSTNYDPERKGYLDDYKKFQELTSK